MSSMFPNGIRIAALLSTVSFAIGAHAQSSLSIPQPDPEFKGKIAETLKDSIPSYPTPLKAPQGAPNVLVILLDDVGFGHASAFGGPVPTPTLDRLAKNGLMYNTFHTTALCSPSRAALLTGRNHHSVGTGVIIEMGTGFPGYTGIIPQSTAMIPEILRDNGYATAMFGKWHNTPEVEISPAGPLATGLLARGSTIFMDSTRVRPTSGTHHFIETPPRSRSPSLLSKVTISLRT